MSRSVKFHQVTLRIDTSFKTVVNDVNARVMSHQDDSRSVVQEEVYYYNYKYRANIGGVETLSLDNYS